MFLFRVIPACSKTSSASFPVIPLLLKSTNIKSRTAYAENSENSYHYHRMYNTAMGDRYNHIGEPPYEAYKLPVVWLNKTLRNDWLESVEDPVLKNGFKRWFDENPDRKYTTILLPDHLVGNYGLPKDLVTAADIRRACFATVEPYYHVLECLGVYMMDDHRSLLVSDYHGREVIN